MIGLVDIADPRRLHFHSPNLATNHFTLDRCVLSLLSASLAYDLIAYALQLT